MLCLCRWCLYGDDDHDSENKKQQNEDSIINMHADNKEQKLQTKLLNEMLEQLKLIKGEFRRVGGIRVSKVF